MYLTWGEPVRQAKGNEMWFVGDRPSLFGGKREKHVDMGTNTGK